jgi:hypothetical protein
MLCLTNSFNSCQSGTTTIEQKKDPNKPKRARHATQLFTKDNRGRISKDNPHCTSVEVTQICEKEFQTVDAKTKAKYSAMHKADVIRFQQEMKTYTVGGRCDLSQSGTTTREQKRFYKLRCCLRISKENRGLRFGEVIKLCNKEWAALAATEKEDNRKMLVEYISRQSKQDIPWHGQPYSLIPWLWSIALFHHTLA